MIGLLGGSFDPIHHGHLLVAQSLRESLGLEQLWLVPAGQQPFKAGQHRASGAQRAAMVALAIADQPGMMLERLEVEREGPSYSVETLRTLRTRNPAAQFALLIGADAARDLPKWYQAEALPGLAEVIAFGRAGVAAEAHPLISRRVTVPAIEISATGIRRRVAEGKSIRYWVPDAVAAYVAEHGLYRKTEA